MGALLPFAIVESRQCKTCLVGKPISAFGRDPRLTDGHRSKCMECANASRRAARAQRGEPASGLVLSKADSDHPDLAGRHRFCKQCRAEKSLADFPKNSHSLFGRLHLCSPCYAEYQHEQKKKTRAAQRAKYRFRAYGVTLAEIEAAFARQDGCCAICKSALDLNMRDAHVDHDHATGRFRGILCRSCNWGLGNFRDNHEALSAAISYLKEHR